MTGGWELGVRTCDLLLHFSLPQDGVVLGHGHAEMFQWKDGGICEGMSRRAGKAVEAMV